ncbi:nucleotidyltransferase domain-containing protein [Cyanobium sp. HWJ4-Hawea]|uniref:nucleotidyltransferase domain-containing protein n=1 Tax=Cyanobium sp. HWJ4-Hawea TaxID=2823713 RepID=UPI0020CB7310|nr:nucleotidyltransferase domain-containing protein [Cyanobium sp. HWJ4-Hawea]MCP9810045.1 nucleotidyltransferase domain-containing protein [Cyanobium sp. HWJ4-Hawea]
MSDPNALGAHPAIAGLPHDTTSQILELLAERPAIQRVVLYGSRALGRHRSGSDIDLCLEAPEMGLAELLVLGAQLDDLLLPWRIDLQLRHLVRHSGLLEHIDRAGIVLHP